MVSSKVMPSASSSSAANSDLGACRLPHSPSSSSSSSMYSRATSVGRTPKKNPGGSVPLDDLLRSIHQYVATADPSFDGEDAAARPPPLPTSFAGKMAEEVWKELAEGGGSGGGLDGLGRDEDIKRARASPEVMACGEMTLEEFLVRAGAVMEEEVRVPSGTSSEFPMNLIIGDEYRPQERLSAVAYGDEAAHIVDGGRRERRGRKRLLVDTEDKAELRRQKRMIKNRESSALSRERKQAYTVKLEHLVAVLQEENARLLHEQEEQQRIRLQQLKEVLIPVTEEKKPRHALRRTHSMPW